MVNVLLDNVNICTEYNCYLATKNVGSANPQTNLLEIPLRDGSIDLTEYLTDDVKYKNRKVTFSLLYLGDDSASAYTQICTAINGQKKNIIFSDEPDYYYTGRIKVKKYKTLSHGILIEIETECDPFKYDVIASDVDWEWDSFNLETGVINEAGAIVVNNSVEFTLIMKKKRAFPTFTVSGNITLIYKGKSYVLRSGANKIYDLFLTEGENDLKFTGNGTVSIKYVGGSL